MFWQKKREKSKKKVVASSPESGKKRKVRGPSVAMEVKLAAVDALASGLNASEVAELIGVSDTTVLKWRRIFDKGGIDAFRRSPSTVAVRKRCKVLEDRIISRRQPGFHSKTHTSPPLRD